MRLTLVLVVLALVGCGGTTTYDASDVQRAFGANGLPLHRTPSRGAEQPAMGETSPCATRFVAATTGGNVVVSICDDPDAHRSPSGYLVSRGNVVVEYSGNDERTGARIRAALEDLD